jgi:hypothetical protein
MIKQEKIGSTFELRVYICSIEVSIMRFIISQITWVIYIGGNGKSPGDTYHVGEYEPKD